MQFSLYLFIGIFLATSVAFGEEPKPNTLTSKEVRDGWLLLFDGETTFGWKALEVVNKNYWEFAAKDGALVLEGKWGGFAAIEYTSPFRHFELRGEYKVRGRTESPWAGLAVDLVHTERSIGNYFPVDLPATDDWRPFSVRLAPQERLVTVDGKVVHKWKAVTGPDKNRFVPVNLLESQLRFFAPERGDVGWNSATSSYGPWTCSRFSTARI